MPFISGRVVEHGREDRFGVPIAQAEEHLGRSALLPSRRCCGVGVSVVLDHDSPPTHLSHQVGFEANAAGTIDELINSEVDPLGMDQAPCAGGDGDMCT